MGQKTSLEKDNTLDNIGIVSFSHNAFFSLTKSMDCLGQVNKTSLLTGNLAP